MIDPRRLSVLQAVAVHGSVAGAASALHLSPPAVSQQLLALERETGARLIDRSGRQVRLTERDLAELTGQASGPVRIAAFQSVMAPLIGPALRSLAAASPAIQPVITERYGPPAVADLRLGDLDIVLTEYDAASPPPAEPGLGLRQLAFDPYLLVIPPDWQVRPRSLGDLAGRPWVAGPPGTACDHALRRLAAEAGIGIPAGDVCVEFPSVLALAAAGRGAAIIPRLALGQSPVTVCTLPPLGGRHIAAWHQAGPAQPTPATATVLSTLAQASEASRQTS